ncbi:protein scribble homolog [Anopheles marshallii]|uniref:protein scribble homolog n=1 Tax=Anopheles marshallii TaxID=1521116 RepID=UPI00237B616E|nr:protein scribble homolog [Anopheles marshallii]
MDLLVLISVRLLFLLINAAALFSATHLLCLNTLKCIISDVKTVDDLFVLQYVAKNIYFVVFERVQMEHLDTALLNRVGDSGRNVIIQQSETLARLCISAESTVVTFYAKSTSLKSIHFETNHHLRLLSVSYSKIVTIPPTVHRGIGLSTFEISNSAIRKLDLALFCDIPLLKVLDFNANKIRGVVNSCRRVCKVYDSLKKLILSNNLLKTVSMNHFRPFVQLGELRLNDNLIRLLTGTFASDMLQELDVSDNKLKAFSLCQWRIPFLTVLLLNLNQLTALPACLDNLKSLKKLDMEKNRISSIEFRDLVWMDNLELILLTHNTIRSITLNSSDFPMKLKKIYVDRNNITALNLLFVPVEALEVNAAYNFISSFNITATSKHIKKLIMLGNPMDCSWDYPAERMSSKCYYQST